MTGSDDRDARPTTRRRMLMRLGLAATAVYAAPTLLQLSHAQAQVGTSRSLPSFTRPSYSAPSFSRPRAGVHGAGYGDRGHDGGHGRRHSGWARGGDGARPWHDRLNPFRR